MDSSQVLSKFTSSAWFDLMKNQFGIELGCNIIPFEKATVEWELLPFRDNKVECGRCLVSRAPASATLRLGLGGVTSDSLGNIYISDRGNAAVRSVNIWNVIDTYAGDGTLGYIGDGFDSLKAELNGNSFVVTDSYDNLFIADTDNNVVRKVNAVTGIITTIAGTSVAGYSGDAGLATAAKLNKPGGLCFDSFGHLLIADTGNNVIRKIDTTGIITTVVGTGTAGYTGDTGLATLATLNKPIGVAVDYLDNFYVADTDNNVLRFIDSSGNINTVAGTGVPGYSGDTGYAITATLNKPYGISCDNAGNVFIADYNNHTIRYYNAELGTIKTYAGTGVSGYTNDGWSANLAKLSYPTQVHCNYFRELLICDTGNNVIRQVGAGGIIGTIAGNGVAGYTGDEGPAAYYIQVGIPIVDTSVTNTTTPCTPYPPVSISVRSNRYTADKCRTC